MGTETMGYTREHMSQEEYDRRLRLAEDEGRIPIRGRAGGVVYLYREYVPDPADPLAVEYTKATDNYIEMRWAMGKAPDRYLWDYGRSELRRVFTAAPAHFKSSGFYSTDN